MKIYVMERGRDRSGERKTDRRTDYSELGSQTERARQPERERERERERENGKAAEREVKRECAMKRCTVSESDKVRPIHTELRFFFRQRNLLRGSLKKIVYVTTLEKDTVLKIFLRKNQDGQK